MNSISPYSIGLFDSGVGGLSVFYALENAFPQESFIYFADTKHFPYGDKSPEEIRGFCWNNMEVLRQEGVKIIVIACHTASCHFKELHQKFPQIFLMDIIRPSIAKAAETTKNNKVGLLATKATVDSKIYTNLFKKSFPQIAVFEIACPKLAPQVEQHLLDTFQTREMIRDYLKKIEKEDIDTLILGSTHFSHLAEIFREECKKEVFLIDTAKCIPSVLQEAINTQNISINAASKPRHTFLVSGEIDPFLKFLSARPPKSLFTVTSYSSKSLLFF